MHEMTPSYENDTEFPTYWNETKQETSDNATGGNSKNMLINQLITNLKTTDSTSLKDEADPLGSGNTVLEVMRSRGTDVNSLGDDVAVYLPSSTKFNARLFLQNYTNAELESSLDYLKSSMSRKPKGKVNVDEDYEKFVTSKQQLDQVLNMISGNTSEGIQTGRLADQIDEVILSSRKLKNPIEEAGNIKDRYQTANSLAKSFKYVFSLPHTLQKHLNNQEHDEFVRDWRAGREYLTEFKESSNAADCHDIAKLVEERVRAVVEKYRASVWKQLMATQVDKLYSRNLEMLADLEVPQNPLYEWMKHQVNQIHNSFTEFFERAMQTLTNLHRCDQLQDEEVKIISYIKQLDSGSGELDSYDVIEHWMLFQQVFGSLQEHVIKAMSFWKECNAIVSGRKVVGNLKLDKGQEAELRDKFHGVVEHVCRSTVALIQNNGENSQVGNKHVYFPTNANSLSTAKYLNQIMTILLNVEKEISQPMFSQTLAHIRNVFVKIVGNSWLRDSEKLGGLQNFRKHDAAKSLTSSTECFTTFHKWIIARVHQLDPQGGSTLDATLAAVLNASLKSYKQYLVDYSKTRGAIVYGLSPEPIDEEIRLLITMNNLDGIRKEGVPSIYAVYDQIFRSKGSKAHMSSLDETSVELSNELFSLFTQKKRAQISKIVADGIKEKRSRWNQSEDPVYISQHIYEALMLMVDIESEFSIYAPKFIGSVLSNLYHHFLCTLLQGVREFDQLGQLGTLQLIADTEFASEIMGNVHNHEDQKIFGQIQESIKEISGRSLYTDRTGPAERVAPLVERALDEEKTAFACFKSVSA